MKMADPCVVAGMEVVTALGAGLERNWEGLRHGICAIRPMTRFSQELHATRYAAEVSKADQEFMRHDLTLTDISLAYLLGLWVARRALNQADWAAQDLRIGLILSTTKADLDDFEGALNSDGYRHGRRFNPYVMASDLARTLGLSGPVFAVSNACASGLVALIQGARLLERGTADCVLVVGVDVLTDFVIGGFSSLRALSPKPARPFDEERDGLSLGEGAAAMLLTRQSRQTPASARGERTTLLGWAVSNDAEHMTAPSRDGTGLRLAMERALQMAGQAPVDIDYVNAHGTGTLFNDEMESQAIAAVFSETPSPPTTSMKGSIGHTLGAAGVIEAALSIKAMAEKVTPPSTGFAKSGVSKPLNIPTEPLASPGLSNVLCLKSGFGGVNAVLSMGRESVS